MKIDIIKMKSNKIKNKTLTGCFLGEKQGDLVFSKYFEHLLFESSDNCENNMAGLNITMNFEDYIQKFLEICSEVKNSPSLLFLNYAPTNAVEILNKEKKYNFLTTLENAEDFEILNSKPSITCVQGGIIDTLAKLVETRSNGIAQNDVFVFFNEPEEFSNLNQFPNLERILTVSKSRRIYFVFNFKNSAKYIDLYGEYSYELIKSYCQIKFNTNNTKII